MIDPKNLLNRTLVLLEEKTAHKVYGDIESVSGEGSKLTIVTNLRDEEVPASTPKQPPIDSQDALEAIRKVGRSIRG